MYHLGVTFYTNIREATVIFKWYMRLSELYVVLLLLFSSIL